jgi:predicted nucleotidyltransferase
MSQTDLPAELRAFRADLTRSFPAITEVWLFGSRANGTATDASDWDLLVLSDDSLKAEDVAPAERFRSERFELFIAHGDTFECPWPRARDGVRPSGDFPGWKWRWEGDTAIYEGTSLKPGQRTGWKRAIRIWKRPVPRCPKCHHALVWWGPGGKGLLSEGVRPVENEAAHPDHPEVGKEQLQAQLEALARQADEAARSERWDDAARLREAIAQGEQSFKGPIVLACHCGELVALPKGFDPMILWRPFFESLLRTERGGRNPAIESLRCLRQRAPTPDWRRGNKLPETPEGGNSR